MRFRKLNPVDKVFIIVLVNFICKICYDIYINDYRKIIFAVCCMVIPVIIYVYYKFKYKANLRENIVLSELPKYISIKSIIESFFKQVPGFRTGEKANMITLVYII